MPQFLHYAGKVVVDNVQERRNGIGGSRRRRKTPTLNIKLTTHNEI
jgi:hypothetical protein